MSLKVSVVDLVGRSLELELPAKETVKALKDAVATPWDLDPLTFRLLAQGEQMDEEKTLESFRSEGEREVQVQLLKFDPLWNLGQFVRSKHRGIRISGKGGNILTKTQVFPDSCNVFLRHGIQEPCFVEFEVVCCGDEMSFGVTYDKRVVKLSDHDNLDTDTTWIFSKKQSMPVFFLGGKEINPPDVPGVQEGDVIVIYVDPEARLVEFYCNTKLVGSTESLEVPLPQAEGRPLLMYAMVDQVGDKIRIKRFGPGRPYH
ncbi:unnamed protein product [Symbiodinium microadriaticum]|nr:unnamed protein product [Symbiodinium sp. KB8]CAE7679245.1 unnamed protein product [Symbiodinium microadriaticum]